MRPIMSTDATAVNSSLSSDLGMSHLRERALPTFQPPLALIDSIHLVTETC